jgi:hypothetical protein
MSGYLIRYTRNLVILVMDITKKGVVEIVCRWASPFDSTCPDAAGSVTPSRRVTSR